MISWKEGEKGGMRVAKNEGVKEGGSESRRESKKEVVMERGGQNTLIGQKVATLIYKRA